MRLKKEKCDFLLPRVDYLGHRINSNGLEPAASKVVKVNAPTPRSLTELRSMLGMHGQLLQEVLPDVATVLAPVHRLLQKSSKWQ